MDPLTAAIIEAVKALGPAAAVVLVLVWRLRIADADRAAGASAREASQEAFLAALSEHGKAEVEQAHRHQLSLQEIVVAMKADREATRAEHERMMLDRAKP